jgi:hypothetical protein
MNAFFSQVVFSEYGVAGASTQSHTLPPSILFCDHDDPCMKQLPLYGSAISMISCTPELMFRSASHLFNAMYQHSLIATY